MPRVLCHIPSTNIFKINVPIPACRVGADVAILLDASSSLGVDNFKKSLDFARELVLGLNVNGDSRVAMVTFSTSAVIQFNLTTFSKQVDILNGISQTYP